MVENEKRAIVAEADHCLCHAKPGTFAIMRTPDGNLWYVGAGTQSCVRFLRVRCGSRVYDEKRFRGILAIRDNPRKDVRWFVHYDLDNKQMPYIASSWDDHPDFSCVAIAEGPKNRDDRAPICVLSVFRGMDCAIVRAQDAEVAKALMLLEKPALPAVTGNFQDNSLPDDVTGGQEDLPIGTQHADPFFNNPVTNTMWI